MTKMPATEKILTCSPDCPHYKARKDRTARRFEALLEISNLVGSVLELDEILNEIVTKTNQMFEASVCSIYLLGPGRQNLVLRANIGLGPASKEYIGQARLPLGRGLPGIAAQNNELIAVPNASKDPRHQTVHGSENSACHAYICTPLRIQDEVVGVLTARRDCGHAFNDEDTTLFQTIAKQVAIVIEKSKMYYEKLEADRLATISISLSEVAHYIKNLLQGMKGGIFFVDRGLKRNDMDATRKGWEVLQRGNRKIASLVENMLNYSRDMRLNLQNHSVNSLIYEILQQIDDTAVERGVALMPETHRNLPNILFDHDCVYDALLNLITNAIDAIPEGKTDGLVMVRSRISDDGKYAEIIVEDNGAGIAEETREKMFNLFFSTKGNRGSGIGLAVTRKIIEEHKGQIDVKSELGKGAIFTMRFPLNSKVHDQS